MIGLPTKDINDCDSRLFEQGGLNEALNIEFLEPRSNGVVAKMPITPRHSQNRKKRESRRAGSNR
jgi:hypothetical protein